MLDDPLEQLAQLGVPPTPVALDESIHHRLNHTLFIGHVVEFALRALPYALLQFLPALADSAAPGMATAAAERRLQERDSNLPDDKSSSDGSE